MKLACGVEVVRHCGDLEARQALKTDRSVFKARRQEAITEIASRPQSKTQSVKKM